ncbi:MULTISPECIES: hypothetical protein [unclassified Mesorhizobium]|uniref:hypothetical protein n=1 Tax=unclassified Mesorhizobium TaxID=325217 RepID=UPI001FEE6CF3|nr:MULTISPECIES: hypothetical protein [unclassified Mesorhizobium]
MDRSARIENLQFAASMLRQIRRQINSEGEELLTYLVDMAYLEALERTRSIQSGGNEIDYSFERTIPPD